MLENGVAEHRHQILLHRGGGQEAQGGAWVMVVVVRVVMVVIDSEGVMDSEESGGDTQ